MKDRDNKASAQSVPLWTNWLIAKHVREAMLTLTMLPEVTVQKYLHVWPEIMEILKAFASKKLKLHKTSIALEAIMQLENVLQWMCWIDTKERKLIWMRAARVSWKIICREFKCCRSNASAKLALGFVKISSCLNAH